MTKKRVVVTGLGCLTPIGSNKDDFWKSLLEGKSGAKTIDFLDVDKLPVKFSASVKDFQSDKYFDKKDLKKMDLFMQYGMAAGIDAVADAKLLESQCNPDRIGVSIGSGIGGLYNIENTRDTFIKSGSRRISPFFVPGLTPAGIFSIPSNKIFGSFDLVIDFFTCSSKYLENFK